MLLLGEQRSIREHSLSSAEHSGAGFVFESKKVQESKIKNFKQGVSTDCHTLTSFHLIAQVQIRLSRMSDARFPSISRSRVLIRVTRMFQGIENAMIIRYYRLGRQFLAAQNLKVYKAQRYTQCLQVLEAWVDGPRETAGVGLDVGSGPCFFSYSQVGEGVRCRTFGIVPEAFELLAAESNECIGCGLEKRMEHDVSTTMIQSRKIASFHYIYC